MSPNTLKPGYDAELHEVLKQFPSMDGFDHEVLKSQRPLLAITPDVAIPDPSISHEEVSIPGPGGQIKISVLRSRVSAGGARPAVLYLHGGGMVLGNQLLSISLMLEWVKQLDAVVFSVDYRLAPEHPAPAALDDCYASLEHISKNAAALGIDPEKIMIAGSSAGGGLSAGVSIMARDRNGPKLLAQCLIYPMLDDRMGTVSSSQFFNEGTWTGKSNLAAWDMYLSGRRGKAGVSLAAAPGRATAEQLRGLPPAWVDVGSAELFRDEDVGYANKLWEAGVQVELHVWPGAWHSFDMLAPQAEVSKVCLETRLQWAKRIFAAGPEPPKVIPAVL
ncbi:hypothetical protein BP6252_08407 [Coleophoma cylindrospora]|uniref:Alpha/beta hydrolase fold-3 domain-containing protein n=1 Tax=Coleophoma cylindrospora TaxID=1849047 RepID=A0A3D8R5V9_9HELO|nr:hypothetical protein BP6252_08407 [Coleophoma cylindrospora]